MKYEINKGNNNHLIITLHGTGGNASSLFDISTYIDPQATIVGFEGKVLENGYKRFFARYPQGGFDLDSLDQASKELNESINNIIQKYNFYDKKITIIGYSNGANLAKDLLKKFERVKINNIILLHPSPITPNQDFKDQTNLNVFMTSGKHDPYINESQFQKLANKMIAANINLKTYTHTGGHQVYQEELDKAKELIENNFKEVINND